MNRESYANTIKDVESVKIPECKPAKAVPWEYAYRIDTSDVEWPSPNDKKVIK